MAKGMTDQEKSEKAKELIEDAIALMAQLDADTEPLIGDIQGDLDGVKSNIEALSFDEDGGLIPGEDTELDDEEDWEEDNLDWRDDT